MTDTHIYIYISREISIEHPSVGLASLAQLIHWPSGTTSGSNSIFVLFHSIYLDPEIKNVEETPYYGRESFLGGRSLHFVLHVNVEARKLSNHTISVGGWSLILDKNLYF